MSDRIQSSEKDISPTDWAFRVGYRGTGGPASSHGVQLLGGPTFKISDRVKIGVSIEWNNMFLFSDKPPNTYFMEIIPEANVMLRPLSSVPFELGVRFGFGVTYATVPKTPGNSGNCIPGDIYCAQSPIPQRTAGAESAGRRIDDSSEWASFTRIGPRIVFPIHEIISLSSEYLFQYNSKSDSLDMLWRSAIKLVATLGKNVLLVAEPRYIMKKVTGQYAQHGFDFFAGVAARW